MIATNSNHLPEFGQIPVWGRPFGLPRTPHAAGTGRCELVDSVRAGSSKVEQGTFNPPVRVRFPVGPSAWLSQMDFLVGSKFDRVSRRGDCDPPFPCVGGDVAPIVATGRPPARAAG